MEWVVTTGTTIDEAKERALDQLGVAADEAEFEIVEEPKTGLFGRLKVEARVRARVKPTQVRPKNERRDRRRGKQRARSGNGGGGRRRRGGDRAADGDGADVDETSAGADDDGGSRADTTDSTPRSSAEQTGKSRQRSRRQRSQKEKSAMDEDTAPESAVAPQEVADAAVEFMTGLGVAIGAQTEVEVEVDGHDIDVRMTGSELGLLVGPGGRTLAAVQDLARVASQRRLGDHDTRLRIDVGGYREKRKAALEKFAVAVARQVSESGRAKALEPMSSADRKAVHDAIGDVDGVSSRSEGDEPNRRVVISPS